MTRTGWALTGVGFLVWALSPLLWVTGKLPLDTSLFIGSTALLPCMIYFGIGKRGRGGDRH